MNGGLAEPVVLAGAKQTLYPDVSSNPNAYVVTDTQFTQDTWGDWSVPKSVKEQLRPLSPIRLESGEPDLLGVGVPDSECLASVSGMKPVVAVEAKGHNTDPSAADVDKAITQAHDRLSEVNAGFIAAPTASISETDRALARNLNVGVVGVDGDANGVVLEPARVVGGGDFSREVEAIQFEANTHQLTDGSFPVNHPKNYLGYVLSVASDEPTEELYREYVIEQVEAGRRGAQLLGLVDVQPGGESVTHLGGEIVRHSVAWCDGPEAALREFDAWWGSSKRFTQLAPRWAQLARNVVVQYPPGELIIEALENLHSDGVSEVTLPVLVEEAMEVNRTLAVEVFLAEGKRDAVLTQDGDPRLDALIDPSVFKSGVYYQLKAQFYHTGLVTSRGVDDQRKALTDTWQLETSISKLLSR